jgi:Peptidase S46
MFRKTVSGLAAAALALLLAAPAARADEGMWLPLLVKRLNYVDMQKEGLRLTAEEIYDVNNASLKDAIGQLGGFCTAEFVSKDGLLLTNHHCGFDAIQNHSSPQNDLLTNGFVAKTKADELTNPGLFVDVLVRMEDVTGKVLEGVSEQTADADRAAKVSERLKTISEEAKANGKYVAYVRDFLGGNEYYLFVYQRFLDVRLVAAPPQSIGKFGGDTDNWMWPRHTGDFSVFRVYANEKNEAAPYAATNKPYAPKKHLPVSLSGVDENDFAMVFGFPGRTTRYMASAGVKLTTEVTNPARVKLRDKRLKLMKEDMDQSADVRIKYAATYASVANYWKFWQGETEGVRKLGTVAQKKALEDQFQQWADADAERKAIYGSALADINAAYAEQSKYVLSQQYLQEGILGVDIFSRANQATALQKALKANDAEAIKKASAELTANLEELYKDFVPATDQKIAAAMLRYFAQDVPKDQQPDIFATIQKDFGGDYDRFAKEVFNTSMFASKAKVEAFLKAPTLAAIDNDLAFKTVNSAVTNFTQNIAPKLVPVAAQLARGNRRFIQGQRLMNPTKSFYPDANSTIRLSYGTVREYKPRDGVQYHYFTTLDGIAQKEDPTNEEFMVPAKLMELYHNRDFGRYADAKDGKVHVAFLTDNDITGGNSGSPVINGRGELIGLAFDGNWESMNGNIVFDPALKRCINNDIRYVLFVIDKVIGGKHLVDEMSLVSNGPNPEPGSTGGGKMKKEKKKKEKKDKSMAMAQ